MLRGSGASWESPGGFRRVLHLAAPWFWRPVRDSRMTEGSGLAASMSGSASSLSAKPNAASPLAVSTMQWQPTEATTRWVSDQARAGERP